jgi:hypothetical protein
MYSKLNREQLTKLVLYTSEINHILLDAMFSLLPEQEKREVELGNPCCRNGREPE